MSQAADFAVDHFHKVFARLDLVDIDENLILAKVLRLTGRKGDQRRAWCLHGDS